MTDQDCLEKLIQWRWPDGRICPECGDSEAWWLKDYSRWKCKGCGLQYTWIHGTLLAGRKRELKVYVAAIESVRSKMVSANFFAVVVGMQPSAAVKLFQKIRCSERNP